MVMADLHRVLATLRDKSDANAAELLARLQAWWRHKERNSPEQKRLRQKCATEGCEHHVITTKEYLQEAEKEGWSNYCCATCKRPNGEHHGGRCRQCAVAVPEPANIPMCPVVPAVEGFDSAVSAREPAGEPAATRDRSASAAERSSAGRRSPSSPSDAELEMPLHEAFGVTDGVEIYLPASRDVQAIALGFSEKRDTGGLNDYALERLAHVIGAHDGKLHLPRLQLVKIIDLSCNPLVKTPGWKAFAPVLQWTHSLVALHVNGFKYQGEEDKEVVDVSKLRLELATASGSGRATASAAA
jgi:hypothetical protein